MHGQRRRRGVRYVNGHIVVPAASLKAGAQRDRHRVHRRRRVAQPQRRVPLHAVRAGARAAGVSLLRSAGPEGALDADARRPGGVAGGGQRRARSARDGRRRPASRVDVRRDRSRCRPIFRVRRRRVHGRDRRRATAATFRMFHRETDAAKVARNRDAIFDLHAARARLARGLHRRSRIRSASSTSC